jgi:hypothetical protein
LDILERFHTYKTAKRKPILKKEYATDHNILFDQAMAQTKKLTFSRSVGATGY